MYVGMCWVRRESTQVHREGGTVSSKGKTCSVRNHDGGGSQEAGSVRRCSGRPRVDHSSLVRIFFFFFNTLPFPTEYLWSAEYLCCNRVPSGYLCCFLFPQSTSGPQSTSVAAGSRRGTSAASFSPQSDGALRGRSLAIQTFTISEPCRNN